MSLRARLLLALVGLAAAGLLIVDVVTATSLRSFLFRRVDQQLNSSLVPMAQALDAQQVGPGGFQFGRPRGGPRFTSLPPGTYGDDRGASGQIEAAPLRVPLAQPDPSVKPEVPKLDAKLVRATIDAGDTRKITVDSTTGATRYRALIQPQDAGGAFVVAVPLGDGSQTLHRLVLIEVAVSV